MSGGYSGRDGALERSATVCCGANVSACQAKRHRRDPVLQDRVIGSRRRPAHRGARPTAKDTVWMRPTMSGVARHVQWRRRAMTACSGVATVPPPGGHTGR